MEIPWGKRRLEHRGWDSQVGISLIGYRERKRGPWGRSPEKEEGGYGQNSSELARVRAPPGGSEQRKIRSGAHSSLDSEWQPRALESRQSGSSLLFQHGSILPGFPGGSDSKESAMQETEVWSLGQEDPLEKERQPTPAFLPGEFHGQRSQAGYSPWGHKESDTTKRLNTHTLLPKLFLFRTVFGAYFIQSLHCKCWFNDF